VDDRPLAHYVSPDEDSARWWDFALRPGDIVISTRSRSGTTWTQMICLLLVYQATEFTDSLGVLSPWLDHLIRPVEDVHAGLAAQTHRRVIKTHTPLDGVPSDMRVNYIVVARHPLDAAVSLYFHSANIDRVRLAELTGAPPPTAPPATRPPLHDWLVGWVDWDPDPREYLDSLPGTLHHLADAWSRRDEPNVVLVHYDDLIGDLDGTMRRLSRALGIAVDEERWSGLVHAATFDEMRRGADAIFHPETEGLLKDPDAFFRHGVSGDGRSLLSEKELARYRARAAALAPADLLAWLHRDQEG
jgi:aryl sulfotransferase